MSEQRVLEKIEKLLRLSRSSNEHEAALAAARAAELMLEHHIDEAQLGTGSGEDARIIDEPIEYGGVVRSWRAAILLGLVKEFGCRSYKQTDRIIEVNKLTGERRVVKKVGVGLRVLGRADDVAALRYVFTYLLAEVGRLAEESWRTRHPSFDMRTARGWKESFKLGAAFVIRDRLEGLRERRLEEAAGAGCQALVLVREHDAAVQAALDALNIGRGDNRGVGPSDMDAYVRGAAAGRRMDLGLGRGKGLPAPAPRLEGKR